MTLEISAELRDLINADLASAPMVREETVQKVLEGANIEIGHLMIYLLPIAAKYARTPISHFNVGAVAQGMGLSLYLGSNMEFPGEALSFCVHGEQSATNHAWIKGETGLQSLAVNAAPCGYCRQFLYEISTATKGFQILLKKYPKQPDNYDYTMYPLTYYLPDAFGPGDLNIKARLMQPEDHGLSIASSDPLAQAALQAANASYSPYTGDFCGVALEANKKIFAGRYAENAAYNPSMSPLESALAIMNMTEKEGVNYNITRAVLVESNAIISQKDATEDVLKSVAKGVTLEYYQAS